MSQTFREAVTERFGDGDEAVDTWRDLAKHGADSGWPGLTYYADTSALYDAHEDEIWEALYDDTQSFGLDHPLAFIATLGGAQHVGSQAQFANLLVWYMAERVAREIEDA